MSSGQGDGSSTKDNEELQIKSPEASEKSITLEPTSKDQVDHCITSHSTTDQVQSTEDISESVSKKTETDSGFKSTNIDQIENPPQIGDITKTIPNLEDSDDDEDLHLKWEDDDEQDVMSTENSEIPESNSEKEVPINVNTNIANEEESLDENLLLESSDELDQMEVDNSSVNKAENPSDTEIAEDDIEKLLNSEEEISLPCKETPLIDNTETEVQDLNSNSNAEKVDSSETTAKDLDFIEKGVISVKNVDLINMEASKGNINQSDEEFDGKDKVESEAKDKAIIDDKTIITSSPNESLNTTQDINLDHKLNNPDAMIEIPTQEIIDIMDDVDVSVSGSNDTEQMEISEDTVAETDKDAEFGDTVEAMEVSDEAIGPVQSDNNPKTEEVIELNSKIIEIDLDKPKTNEADIDLSVNTSSVSEDDWNNIEKRLEKFEDLEPKESVPSEVNKIQTVPNTEERTDIETDNMLQVNTNETTKTPLENVDSSQIESLTTDEKKEEKSNIENTNLEVKEIEVPSESKKQVIEAPKTTEDEIKPTEPKIPDIAEQNTHKDNTVETPTNHSLNKIEPELSEVNIDNTNVDSSDIDTDIKSSNQDIKIHSPSKQEVNTAPLTLEQKDIEPSVPIKVIEALPSKLKEDTTVPSSISKLETDDKTSEKMDIDVIPFEMETKLINQTLPAKENEVQSSTTKDENEVLPSTLNEENEVKSVTLKEENDVQPSTSKTEIEIQPSTSKIEIELKPSTSKDETGVPSTSTEENEIKSSSKVQIEVQPSTSKDKIDVQPSTSKVEVDIEVQPSTSKDKMEVQPSTSKVDIEVQPSTSKDETNVPPSSKQDMDVDPCTSELKVEPTETGHSGPDSSDEVSEVADSLGLLAESSRVMEDDEEQEEDDDDEDDFYPEDESSNQMTAEHSEDSNAPHSETDMPKDQEKETDTESPQEEKGQNEFDFTVDVATDKDAAIEKDKDGDMEVDEVVCEDDVEVTTNEIGEDAVVTEETQVVASKTDDKDKPEPKQDIETVKLSDTSDTEDGDAGVKGSMLRSLLVDEPKKVKSPETAKKSPIKKLEITKQNKVLNYVDLEESSSEDDILEVKKDDTKVPDTSASIELDGPIDIPQETVAKTVPATEDKSEKAVSAVNETPSAETVGEDSKPSEDASKPKHKFSLEIFSLDSDEEDAAPEKKELTPEEIEKASETNKCVNIACESTGNVTYYPADQAAVAYYDAARKRKAMVCERCAEAVVVRTKRLVDGIKELTPLLELDIGKVSSELVEISDSDSEGEAVEKDGNKELIGESGAAFIERELAKTINETWLKFRMDERLTEAEDELGKELKRLEEETKEIDTLMSECQVATDKLRNDLYATFEHERHELHNLVIYDTPTNKYTCLEASAPAQTVEQKTSPAETRSKRRASSAMESAAKRPAIPLGYAPLDPDKSATAPESKPESTVDTSKLDDDKDISVLKVSVEAAPRDLPPAGELVRPPLRADMCVYAMRNTFGSWVRAKLLDVQGKNTVPGSSHTFTICRVKLFSRNQTKTKLYPARCLAYPEPADVRMTIGTRVIALFKDPMNEMKRDTFYSGIVAEVPNPVNNYRYLVFFDDGYAQYVRHRDTRPVCECSPLVWEEVHPFSREFVRKYLVAYPERPMVRLHAGQSLKTEWNGKWWTSRVIQVDASLVQVHFEEDNRTEWIYRGSTRLAPLYLELQAAERHRARPMPRTKAQARVNMPYVEYTRSEEQNKSEQAPAPQPTITALEREVRQRAVARKSTAAPAQPAHAAPDAVTSRVVYYTPKNAVKPYKMATHNCGPHCKRKDTLALKDLRTYNPLAKPLLSGWERQIVRFNGHKEVMYRAPCGRRLRNMRELHRYLRLTDNDMPVDLFDFTPHTHCLAEFVLNKCLVGKKDLSHGKENVPVPCVNYYDESLPEFCSYNTERTPTAGVPLNLDPEFLCGCDCTDDCEDKSKCACWKMTLEGARTIGLRGVNVGYVYKRLPEPLPSGIYECNSRCKCKQTCLNRVAQHPLQLKLQVFKTLNRGWGIRALNDVPRGSFLCVYAGNLLTDATANMDGLNEGDEYLAELDYIEVVEQMKEGYEEDIPEADKKLDKVHGKKEKKHDKKSKANLEEPETSSSEEEEAPSKDEKEDGDFQPGVMIGMGVTEFSKRLRKRDKIKKEKGDGAKETDNQEKKDGDKADEDCITISDDEEVREPSRFMAEAGMESNEFVSKYRSVRSHFGKDEACYIMDAKVQGNIGRYLNHSCMPNVFVQNVFVDTHDPRFPWVAFFALSHIKAGTELTWNYNYDVGSVPGKALYCYCGAPNCRGRLL